MDPVEARGRTHRVGGRGGASGRLRRSTKHATEAPEGAQLQPGGLHITFDHPRGLTQTWQLKFGTPAGSADAGRAAVGINKDDVILVSRYDLNRPVTTSNVGAVEPEVDGVIKSLAGKPIDCARIDVDGLPGYGYRVSLGSPIGEISRLYVLFDRKVEYFSNCQSTPETGNPLARACVQAHHTFRPNTVAG